MAGGFHPDPSLYPFSSRSLEVAAGEVLHYVDEGDGEPVVFVHGTPTWSFIWRQLITELRRDYRCLALDHLGFGLSAKPPGADYTPAAHARRLTAFIEQVAVKDMNLVVHDFGGPIAFHYALAHAARIRSIVVMNSWLWSLADDRQLVNAGRLFGSRFGRFLYLRCNLSPRLLLRLAFASPRKLTPEVHRHYQGPFPTPETRIPTWTLARELMRSSRWFDDLYARRGRLARIPVLILWGKRDRFLSTRQFARWREAFPEAKTASLDDVGHFVQEEAPQAVLEEIRAFLQ